MEQTIHENKMGVKPVPTLMLTMGLPMILSMMIQAFYNIVDSYFVSQIKDTPQISNMGDCAVNALTLSFPIQMLIIAIGVGTGVGINSLLSKTLGENNKEKASLIAGNATFLGICTYAVFLLFGLFGINTYLSSQTNDPIIIELGTSYLYICCVLSFGAVGSMIYEKLLQSTGKTVLSTIAQLIGALTNIILDPILIFGIGPFPQMGIKGAAVATVIGQILTMIISMVFHYTMNKEINGSVKYIKPDGRTILNIYKIGIPAIIMQALMSVMSYGVNVIFGMVSSASVTAFGIYYKIQQFVFFAAFGMNNAIIPIVAFNYGKGDKKRVNSSVKFGILYTLILMLIGALALQLFANQICGVFSLSNETLTLCVRAIRIITLGYLFAGTNIALQGVFQALGYGMRSLAVSAVRLIIAELPLAYIFGISANAEKLIWLSFPIAEFLGFIISLIYMRQIYKNTICNINA